MGLIYQTPRIKMNSEGEGRGGEGEDELWFQLDFGIQNWLGLGMPHGLGSRIEYKKRGRGGSENWTRRKIKWTLPWYLPALVVIRMRLSSTRLSGTAAISLLMEKFLISTFWLLNNSFTKTKSQDKTSARTEWFWLNWPWLYCSLRNLRHHAPENVWQYWDILDEDFYRYTIHRLTLIIITVNKFPPQ